MIVAWPSASNSVQSIATVMRGRWPTTKGTQWRSRASTSIPWLDSRRSTCLTACLVASPRAKARPCPMSATASEADTIAPIVAPASDRTRLACRSSANRVRRKRWTLANEIWLLTGIVSPPPDRAGWNRRSAHHARQSAARYPSTIIGQAALSTFVSRAPQIVFNSFKFCKTEMRGALSVAVQRRRYPTLRRPPLGWKEPTLPVAARRQRRLNQAQDPAVGHTLSDQREELLVRHGPEEILQVRIDDPLRASFDLSPDLA